jgi:hypothetical protein
LLDQLAFANVLATSPLATSAVDAFRNLSPSAARVGEWICNE